MYIVRGTTSVRLVWNAKMTFSYCTCILQSQDTFCTPLSISRPAQKECLILHTYLRSS